MSTLTAPPAISHRSWIRLVKPSLFDCFLLSIIFWSFFLLPGSWDSFVGDADTGLHVRTGEFVLDHWSVPTRDLYSFSLPDKPWFAFEWLVCTVFAVIHRAWGVSGLAVICAAMIVGFLGLSLRDMLRRGASLLIALPLCLIAYRAASIHYLARPHVFTMMLFTITVWAIERDRERPTRALWLFIPLTVVWTNLHGGFVILPVYLAILSMGTFAESLWRSSERLRLKSQAIRYSLLTIGCVLASLVNPYGVKLHLHIYHFLGATWLTDMIQEFASPLSMLDERIYWYLFLVGASLVVCAGLLSRRRVVEPLWIAFFVYSSMKSARHITIFVIAITPIIAVELTRWWELWAARQSRRSIAQTLRDLAQDLSPAFRRTSLAVPGLFAVLLAVPIPFGLPTEFPRTEFPASVIERHQDLITHGRVFTTDHWGDYLVYRYYPQQKIFVDGRGDFFGREIGEQYLTLLEGDPGWRELLKRWDFNVILCPTHKPLARFIAAEPGWRVLAQTPQATLAARIP